MGQHFSPKDFLEKVLIEDLSDVVESHPYYAFSILCEIIEVLGKSMDTEPDWHKNTNRYQPFVKALSLPSLQKYNIKQMRFYEKVRCGLLHAGIPENGIILTKEQNDLANLKIGCKELYEDVKKAWKYIDNNSLAKKDMSKALFTVIGPDSASTQTLCSSPSK